MPLYTLPRYISGENRRTVDILPQHTRDRVVPVPETAGYVIVDMRDARHTKTERDVSFYKL